MAHFAGLVAGDQYPNPVPYADYVTSTTHKTLRGPRGGLILCSKENITKVNSKIFPGIQGGPLEHVIAAKAVCFGEALQPEFKSYAKQTVQNARALGEALKAEGIRLVTGGTDNHLLLVDLSNENITGKDAEKALGAAGITVNKNTIPRETRSPFITSGIRVGTPALTTRGMKEVEMKQIAFWMAQVIRRPSDHEFTNQIRNQVRELCNHFPIY